MSEVRVSSDGRYQKRECFTIDDKYVIEFSSDKQSSVKANVLNLTSFGCLVVLPVANNMAEFFCNQLGIAVGAKVLKLNIYYNNVLIGSYAEGLIVHLKLNAEQISFGIFFEAREIRQGEFVDERNSGKRFVCNLQHLPRATVKHPFQFDKIIHFEICNVSSRGAKLITSACNRTLLKGSKLPGLSLVFPMQKPIEIDVTICYLEVLSNDRVVLGVSFDKVTDELSQSIVQYLINFSEGAEINNLKVLRANGFQFKKIKHNVQFSLVQSVAEYQQVLELRYTAYNRYNKIPSDATVDNMADIFDTHSKIIIAKFSDRIVGSVRMTFCQQPYQQFELESSIEIPKQYTRHLTAEISRLCVSEDFENTDLVHGLFERCVEVGIKSGIRYAISSSEKKLLPSYRRLGFKITKIRFPLKTLSDLEHFFIVHDIQSAKYAHRMNPIVWFFSFGRVVEYLRKYSFIDNEKAIATWKRIFIHIGVWLLRKLKIKTSKATKTNRNIVAKDTRAIAPKVVSLAQFKNESGEKQPVEEITAI